MKNANLILLLAICGIVSRTASAVTVNDFLPRAYTNASGVLPYRLFKPANYNPTNKYPLVVFMHGSGERGADNSRQLSVWPSAMVFADAPNQSKNPSFMIAPQCPNNASWDSTRGDQIMAILDGLKSEFSIDSSRVYVTGLSMGGFGSWYYINLYPTMFAAAAPIASSWDNYFQNVDTRGIPVWTFYGAGDSSPGATRAGVGNLRRAGYNIIYSEYANGGHNVWDDAYRNPTLLSWMYSQKRGYDSIAGPNSWITNPTSMPRMTSTTTNFALSGSSTAGNGGAVFRVDWTNYSATVSAGIASRASLNWSISNILLNPTLTNLILVTGWDSRLNGGLGGFTSFNDTLAVTVVPSITRQPENYLASAGTTATFEVQIPPYVFRPTFQWLFEGLPVAGATNSTLLLTNVQSGQAGDYSVVVSNPFGSVTSSNAVLGINQKPVAVCRPIFLAADERCQADGAIDDGSFDPDGDDITIQQLPAGPYPLGTNSVTLYVTDSRGASNSCVGSVTVLDRTPPQLICPADIVITNSHDKLTSVITYALVGVDNCGGLLSLMCRPPSGSAFGAGVHTVACEATDSSGNTASGTFHVTVFSGNKPPVPHIEVSPIAVFPGWTNIIVIAPDSKKAIVRFDASKSYDLDDASLKYAWSEDACVFSTNVVARRVLKVGTHQIILNLDDTFPSGSGSTNVQVEVISGQQAICILMEIVMESGLPKRELNPLLVTLKAAAASFERSQIKAACNQLRAFQNKVITRLLSDQHELAIGLIESAQVVIDSVEESPKKGEQSGERDDESRHGDHKKARD